MFTLVGYRNFFRCAPKRQNCFDFCEQFIKKPTHKKLFAPAYIGLTSSGGVTIGAVWDAFDTSPRPCRCALTTLSPVSQARRSRRSGHRSVMKRAWAASPKGQAPSAWGRSAAMAIRIAGQGQVRPAKPISLRWQVPQGPLVGWRAWAGRSRRRQTYFFRPVYGKNPRTAVCASRIWRSSCWHCPRIVQKGNPRRVSGSGGRRD